MSEAIILNLGGTPLPLDIEVLETLPVTAGGVIQFDFVYRDILFAARYEQADGALTLAGDCGPLPYTAESPHARAGLGHIVVDANTVLGQTFLFRHNRIFLNASVPVSPPVTATHVISAVATLLVPAIPYLDLIAVYIRPPLAAAKPGESALRPEWRRRPAKKKS